MKYVEVSIEEAMKRCKKNAKVLVAEQDLENDDCEVIFISKGKKDYGELFKDVQTAASLSDDLVKQLRLFFVYLSALYYIYFAFLWTI